MAATTEASSEKSQRTKKGTIEMNSTVVTTNSQPVFNFGDNQVRLVVRDGEPWFVANDICVALGYANSRKAVADHLDDDERMTVTTSDGQNFDSNQSLDSFDKASTQIVRSTSGGKRGGARMMTIINESGLYALVLRSRKPEARKFAKWVTREVLPAIRKTGQYQQPAAQGNPEIDYTRISPAQAQDLREIVKAIVDAKIQGHGETWARFQNKFRVNSYLQLPASRYEEARAYLIGKLPAGYAGEVVQEKPAMSQQDTEQAFTLATQTAAKVSRTVFNGILSGNEDWKRSRFLVSLDTDPRSEELVVRARQLEYNECILPIARFHSAIEDSLSVDPQVLMRLATTCMNKMASMAARSAKALTA